MKHPLVLLTVLLLCSRAPAAQSYDAALGLRLGTDWGATAQLRLPLIDRNFVLEGILQSSLQRDEGSFTLLGKQHQPVLSRRLNLFYGAGLHAGWSNERDERSGEALNGPAGITGILGAEITFRRINISYDIKPALNFRGDRFFDPQTGVSVRYVLAKRNDVWDKGKERDRRKRRKERARDRRKRERQAERERRGKRWWQVWKEKN